MEYFKRGFLPEQNVVAVIVDWNIFRVEFLHLNILLNVDVFLYFSALISGFSELNTIMDWRNWCRLCGNYETMLKIEPDIGEIIQQVFSVNNILNFSSSIVNNIISTIASRSQLHLISRYVSSATHFCMKSMYLRAKSEVLIVCLWNC